MRVLAFAAAVAVFFHPHTPARAFDLAGSSVEADEILSGGPPKDGIPALSQPRFLSVGEAGYLRAADRVVGLVVSGEARAYPLRILNWHEVVNDTIGGKAVAVTYCPLTGSAVAFDRNLNGRTLNFGVSGLLYRSNVLIFDRGTESLWSQLGERAVTGAFNRTPLTTLPTEVTSWEDWQTRHPGTVVLSDDTGHRRDYSRDPYAGYARSSHLMFAVGEPDSRLSPKAPVLGVRQGSTVKAYPLHALPAGSLRDTIGDVAIRIDYDVQTRRARVTDGSSGKIVPSVVAYWFAWAAFHPDTELWVGAASKLSTTASD